MGKGSGTTRSTQLTNRSKADMSFTSVEAVQTALRDYSRTDYKGRYEDYRAGFNADAQGLVEKIAEGDYGLASTIARQAVERPGWSKYGASFSDKQQYVLARAAVENAIVPDILIFQRKTVDNVKRDAARKAAKREERYKAYSSSYTKSSTKVEIGSKVWDSKGRSGVISGIITKSTGYVRVKYDDGKEGKQMAFNLKGEDGNYLKKRPH